MHFLFNPLTDRICTAIGHRSQSVIQRWVVVHNWFLWLLANDFWRCYFSFPSFLTFFLSFVSTLPCADPEVRHSNTEETVLYFIRSKHNLFWTPSLILPFILIRVCLPLDFEDFSIFDISKNFPMTGISYHVTKDLWF